MEERRLDGNAAAGALQELFVAEVTAARGRCAGCGSVDPLGAAHVYVDAPGLVVRCCHCENVLLVVVRDDGRTRLACGGLLWLELR